MYCSQNPPTNNNSDLMTQNLNFSRERHGVKFTIVRYHTWGEWDSCTVAITHSSLSVILLHVAPGHRTHTSHTTHRKKIRCFPHPLLITSLLLNLNLKTRIPLTSCSVIISLSFIIYPHKLPLSSTSCPFSPPFNDFVVNNIESPITASSHTQY